MISFLLIAFLLAPAIQTSGGSVSGHIRLRDGSPAVGIRVYAIDVVDGAKKQAVAGAGLTDSDGAYRIDRVPPGRYYIAAGPLDSLTYYPGASSPEASTVVSVAQAKTLTDMDFRVVKVSISGQVILPAETASTFAGIQIRMARDGRFTKSAVVQADGSFSFPEVISGVYALKASPYPARPLTVTITDQDLANVEVILLPIPQEEARLRQALDGLRSAIERFRAEKNTLPKDLADLVAGRYLPEVPEDPMTQSRDTWQVVLDRGGNDPKDIGIFDVHSGSIALSPATGTPYNMW